MKGLEMMLSSVFFYTKIRVKCRLAFTLGL